MKAHIFVRLSVLLGLGALAGAAAPLRAQQGLTHPARVVVVLCDSLTLDDVLDPRYPALAGLAQRGALGLMNCTVAPPRSPTAATLTLAAGAQAAASDTDEQAGDAGELFPYEDGRVVDVYTRRTLWRNTAPVLHTGIGSLVRRGLADSLLGAALTRSGVRTAIFGNADAAGWGRRAALLAIDATGAAEGDVAADDVALLARAATHASAGCVVLHLGDTARIEAQRPQLSTADYLARRAAAIGQLDRLCALLSQSAAAADLIVVSPYPPGGGTYGGAWERLTPVIAAGPHFPAGLLTSATTRTAGLVANIDLAPTLAALFHAPAPLDWVGRPMTVLQAAGAGQPPLRLLPASTHLPHLPGYYGALRRIDHMSALNAQAVAPLMVAIGGVCFLIALAALIARRHGVERSRRYAPAFVWVENLIGGCLLASVPTPAGMLDYGLHVALWMLALAVLAHVAARALRTTPSIATAAITVLLVAADILSGQALLKDSLMSGYALSGIRFYGIGNEFLGATLGFALAGSFAWLDHRGFTYPAGAPARTRAALVGAWAGLTFLFGWPSLGANAGSLIAAAAGFGVGAGVLAGRRPTVLLAAACAAAGMALSFLFAGLDNAIHGAAASHAGVALHSATTGRGAGYLIRIAERKLAMNLRLLESPWLWLAATFVIGTGVVARAVAGEALRTTLARRPWTARGLAAVAAAMAASLLFKDSGVVTAIYLFGTVCAMLIYEVITGDNVASGSDR